MSSSFEEVFATFAAVSKGDFEARARVVESAPAADIPARLAIELNRLLDDVAARARREKAERTSGDEPRLRLAAIVDSSDDAIIGESLDGIISSWNQGAARVFGYSAAEILGQNISVLFPRGREDEERVVLARLAEGARAEHIETVRRCKDGREIHVLVTISPVRDAAGKPIGASKVVRDITERKLAEVALARAKDAALAANKELEAFSYSVAHDLRAPLRGVNGFAKLLLDTYQDMLDERGLDYLQEILLNANKMGELIDGLLSLARLTKSELRPVRLDLSELVRETTARLMAAEPERRVELRIQEGVQAEMDPRLARALFENLIGNAWKFTSKVDAARIEFGGDERDDAVTLFVRDNGAGFDMAFADKLFTPFQRLHGSSEFPGSGIGLATAERVVRRHGGRLWAEGEVGRGATFHWTIPMRARGSS